MNLANSRASLQSEPQNNENLFVIADLIPNASKTASGNSESQNRAYFNSELLNSHNVINSQQSESQSLQKPRKYKRFWERLREKNETKKQLCVLLSELKETQLEQKMSDCSARFETTTCGKHIVDRTVNFHCGHRACPFCAEIRAQRLINDYLPKAEAFAKANTQTTACHLVITQKHYQNEQLSDSIKRLLSNFRKLIRRSFWKDHFAGGCYAVEFTRGRDGCWHAHLHCLVFRRRYFNVNQFRAAWLDVTGDSVNFKIKRIDTLAGGLNEIIGYISKPVDVKNFKANHLKQVLDLKGTKLFSSFGKFRAFSAAFELEADEPTETKEKQREGDLCEHCNDVLYTFRQSIEQQITFEKYISDLSLQQPKTVLSHNFIRKKKE